MTHCDMISEARFDTIKVRERWVETQDQRPGEDGYGAFRDSVVRNYSKMPDYVLLPWTNDVFVRKYNEDVALCRVRMKVVNRLGTAVYRLYLVQLERQGYPEAWRITALQATD